MYPIEIVVIDDDPTFTAKIEKILSSDNRLKITTFNNSNSALHYIVDEKVNFVISDINMPSLNGDELLYKLRDIKWPVRTAVISNISNMSVAYRCFSLGADIYIKPIAIETIQKIATDFLGRVYHWNSCIDKILADKLKTKKITKKAPTRIKSKPKILLVEDDVEILEYSVQLLNDDYEVLEAKNGSVALEKYHKADLILLDMNMHVMDGFQFLAEVEKDPSLNTPIIIVSGFVDNQCKFDYSNVV